jgi:AcrR family transcriptional regulator
LAARADALKAPGRARQPRLPIEIRREQVLDAALRLIAERGYGAATMEAIAREAQIAKPVVYAAYAGRGELLRALLEREQARALAQLAGAMPPRPVGTDPDTELVEWAQTLARGIAENPTPWRLMLLPADETPELVREHVEAGRRFALEQVRALVGAIVAQRPGLREIDPEIAARAVLAIAEEGAKLLVTEPEEFTPERFSVFTAAVVAALPGRAEQGPSRTDAR